MKAIGVLSSRFFRQVLQRHLVFLSEPPRFFSSIADARKALDEPVDLIFLERHLEDGSGFDFARTVRRDPGMASVPILLVATEIDQALSATSLEAGITEIFSKYELERMASYVRAFMNSADVALRLSGVALVVEDSLPVLRFIREALEPTGLRVETCTTGEEGRDRLAEHDFEIVLVDVLLGGQMTGLSLVRHVRQNAGGRNARVPILAMSGMEDAARRIELLRHGADDFLAKPMLAEELIARVRNMVRIRRLLQETEAQRDHLRRLAMTDQLTGLYNRHYLTEAADRCISEAREKGLSAHLLVIDIDHFKHINDTHGHSLGDSVLAETAARIREVTGANDIVARTGGEEFVVLRVGAGVAGGLALAEAVRTQVERSRPAGLSVTVSIGVAEVVGETKQPSSFESMFKTADTALYQAKRFGRNRVVSLRD
ncbi:diguanylate cyclase [Thauera propionica]|uniref:diguanylate cyclase n=1 Tax=Thauera propionica TaxID=2019431 RepID=UPI0023F2C201|nr:diguanylate cyclase [Thauera propionica]MDD3676413.1 diguanylate cyclase [Thauera propionica]